MNIYAPQYYKNFKCIADKCNHSCCIGWEIDIDEVTLEKYSSLELDYANVIRNTIDNSETPHFLLRENEKCPHLNEKGLCNIILICGESYICDICREHPRFYNYTNQGKEIGIGISCESACDLILSSDDFDQIIQVGYDDNSVEEYEFNALIYRGDVFNILKNNSLTFEEKIKNILFDFNISFNSFDFKSITSQLEYLHNENKILFESAEILYWNLSCDSELIRILAYFIYRHCSESYNLNEFTTSLSFAIFCTGLISTLSKIDDVKNIARIVSEEIEYSEENTSIIKSLFENDGDLYENY